MMSYADQLERAGAKDQALEQYRKARSKVGNDSPQAVELDDRIAKLQSGSSPSKRQEVGRLTIPKPQKTAPRWVPYAMVLFLLVTGAAGLKIFRSKPDATPTPKPQPVVTKTAFDDRLSVKDLKLHVGGRNGPIQSQVRPGDSVYLSFEVKGVPTDYDPENRVVVEGLVKDQSHNSLDRDGDVVTLSPVTVPLDAPPGTYDIKVLVQDPRTKDTDSAAVRMEVVDAPPPASVKKQPEKAVREEREVADVLEKWQDAWQRADLDAFMACYAETIQRQDPARGSQSTLGFKAYRADREAQFAKIGKNSVQLRVNAPKITFTSKDVAQVEFDQKYRDSTEYMEDCHKSMTLKKISGKWKIFRESYR